MTSSLLGWGEGAGTEIPKRGKSLCSASAASPPVGIGAAAVPSAQPLFPEGTDRGTVVSQSSPGSVTVFPPQRSVLRKRKVPLPAPALPLLGVVLLEAAQGGAMGASTLSFSTEKLSFILILIPCPGGKTKSQNHGF